MSDDADPVEDPNDLEAVENEKKRKRERLPEVVLGNADHKEFMAAPDEQVVSTSHLDVPNSDKPDYVVTYADGSMKRFFYNAHLQRYWFDTSLRKTDAVPKTRAEWNAVDPLHAHTDIDYRGFPHTEHYGAFEIDTMPEDVFKRAEADRAKRLKRHYSTLLKPKD
jgi:hypothetical protein